MLALLKLSCRSKMKSLERLSWKVIFVCLMTCFCTWTMYPSTAMSKQTSQGGAKLNIVSVKIGTTTVKAHHANTTASRIEGLLGWNSISYDQGMLLDFGREGEYAIHMQGMKFPIDAVWIDSTKTIRFIYENIQPNSGVTYPSLFKCLYCLELKAGFCKKFNVKVGQKVALGVE
jgi:uncharacterized membrane protein (UPF0127 family)